MVRVSAQQRVDEQRHRKAATALMAIGATATAAAGISALAFAVISVLRGLIDVIGRVIAR